MRSPLAKVDIEKGWAPGGKNGVIRALKKFIKDGTKAKGVICPHCGAENTMEFKEGCLVCTNCSYSKCGG